MHDALAHRASLDPAAAALVDGRTGDATSWAQLDEGASLLAGRLDALGVVRGDRVAIIDTAGPQFVHALHACVRIGAALVPLSPRMPEAELIRHLGDCGATVAITSRAGAEAVAAAATQLGAAAPQIWSFDGSGRAVDSVVPADLDQAEPDEARDVAVVYTSGSSGTPKGVRLTLGNCIASAEGCSEALGGFTADDRWLLVLGPHRVGGLAILWRSVLSGAAVVYVPRFDEASALAALDRRPSVASFVPAMLYRLLDEHAAAALRGLRAILVGGSPVSRAEVLAWTERGLTVCPSYGMTETGSQIAVVPPGRAGELAGTAGFVHTRATVEADSDGTRFGELLVGGPVLSPGYVDDRLSARAFIGHGADRRLRTGDIGFVEHGLVRVIGRRDRMIITGGEKVSPEEVEAVLTAHPAVRDAVVSGAPDARYGSVVLATVDADADAETLRRWCAERLAPYKVPRRFDVVTSVVRSDDSKILWKRREPGG